MIIVIIIIVVVTVVVTVVVEIIFLSLNFLYFIKPKKFNLYPT